MEALDSLDNIIQSDGNSPDDWNNILHIVRNERSE
jgi:hypothetical protein